MAVRGSIKLYRAGLYYRLSSEDVDVSRNGKDESSSISNQKILIKDFLKDKYDIQICGEYADDGVSGSSFERPEFNRMMADIEAGKINCVVVKDLSRFGREYIEAGNLLERVFPSLGVRFIAINDHIDTIDGLDSLMVALKNIMNDAYCRDISIKTRSNLAVKRRHGEYVGAAPVYGYAKATENHNQLVIDDYAAHIVQDIFIWKIQGMSCYSIARKLNEMGVRTPYEYKLQCGIRFATSFKQNEESEWNAIMVRRILTNEIYLGTLIQGKTTTPNHKVKKSYVKDKEQWAIVENAHEAIISKRDFDLVQRTFSLDTRIAADDDKCYPLAGIVSCGNCRTSMVRRPRTVEGRLYVYYECQEYRLSKGKHCYSHSIREDALERIVLEAIRNQIAVVINMDECLSHLDLSMLTEMDRKRINNRIAIYQADIEKNQMMITRLYEDLFNEVISREEYVAYKNEFEVKKKEAEKALAKAEKELKKVDDRTSKHYQWVEHFTRYQTVDELTREMVIELVESVVVHDKTHIEITLAYQDEFEIAMKELQTAMKKISKKQVKKGGGRRGKNKAKGYDVSNQPSGAENVVVCV